MCLPREATFCDVNHPPIAFLGDVCPICAKKALPYRPSALEEAHMWPHAWQLRKVLKRQLTAEESSVDVTPPPPPPPSQDSGREIREGGFQRRVGHAFLHTFKG